MFATELHVRPWEIGDLTVTQFRQAISEFERLKDERENKR